MDFDEFVLAASTPNLAVEPQAREHADALEFRLDLAENPLSQIESYDGESPVIATNRVEWEGGEAPDEPDRTDALGRAVEQQAVEALDIEFAALRTGGCAGLLDHARAHDVAVIVSMHDFERTPDREAIHSMLTRAAKHGDVAKLAVTASSRGDVLALLNATHDATADGHRVATMSMGKVGRHSRVVAPLYGSRIGYAPVSAADATAPGQYDLATLRHLVEQLESAAD